MDMQFFDSFNNIKLKAMTVMADETLQSTIHRILRENRQKAREAHEMLNKFNCESQQKTDYKFVPIYNIPKDAQYFIRNSTSNSNVKQILIKRLRKAALKQTTFNNRILEKYNSLNKIWVNEVSKIENSVAFKTQRSIEDKVFENVFPNLKERRMKLERLESFKYKSNMSEADVQDFAESLVEIENETDRRNKSITPPILKLINKPKFLNNNGLTLNMDINNNSTEFLNLWNNEEIKIFQEKFILHPKLFHIIQSFLKNKTRSDCVKYYYLTKKTFNYKNITKKNRSQKNTLNLKFKKNQKMKYGDSKKFLLIKNYISQKNKRSDQLNDTSDSSVIRYFCSKTQTFM